MSKRIERSIFRRSYLMALGFIGLTSLISFLVMQSILSAQSDYSHLLNISGRQRMLSQKISLEGERLIHHSEKSNSETLEVLRRDLDLFKESHQLITTGTWSVPATSLSVEAKELYYGPEKLDQKVKDYILYVEKIYNQKATETYPTDKLNHLLFLLDKAVKIFENTSKNYFDQLFAVELSLMLTVIISIIIVSIFIFEPYGKKLEDIFSQLLLEKKEAVDARELKSKFMASISHELRTPLHGIIGSVDLIDQDKLSDEEKEYIHIIDSCAHTNLLLVNDLLDFEKLQSEEFSISSHWMSLNILIEEIKRQFAYMANSKGLDFEVIYPKRNLLLFTDKLRLKQVVTNLISNAIKYTPTGSVKFTILEEDNKLRFIVRDSGVGISDEFKSKIFDDFFQITQKGDLKIEGTGLGLAIAKRLSLLLGGDITISDAINDGAEFEFSFSPQVRLSEETDVKDYKDQEKRTFPGLTVLFLEDNTTNQLIFKRYLEKLEINYVMGANGQEGLDLFDPAKFDIVFTDIQMPVMDGIEFFENIKEKYPDLKRHVVAVTANALKEDVEKYEKLGFRTVLAKPTKLNELIILLENILD